MSTKDILEVIYWCVSVCILFATVYYIATGPLNAVKTGKLLNIEQQKDNAKRNLFFTLFSLRGSPVHYDFVRGLNQIDVVFEDEKSVLDAWRAHRNSLDIKGQANAEKNWELQRTRLLSAMAQSLGYSHINETDMMKDYYPEGHDNQIKGELEFRQAALTYYKAGAAAFELLIQNTPPATPETPPTNN